MSQNVINHISDSISSNGDDCEKRISLKEEFFISDFEKYYKYGKTPYLFLIQIVLLILSTLMVK